MPPDPPTAPADLEAILGPHADGRLARRRRRRIATGTALVLALAVAWLFGGEDPTGDIRWTTEAATTGPLVVTVSATGTIQPTNQVEVGSELSGILASVLVDDNDRVTRGQVLARLDTTKLEAEALQSSAELDLARAMLAEREATVEEARAALGRLEAVRESTGGRLPSRQDLDTARATLARARASVANAQAQIAVANAKLDFARTNLARAEILSPIDGLVLARSVEPGQTIAASFQAPNLFTIAEDLSQMELEVDVDEADVGQVREGQKAEFGVDAYPERRFPARILQLRYAPETIDGVVTYKAVLEVDNADLALRPGMTATADIVTATVENALLVPNAALRFVPPEPEERDERTLVQKLVPFSRRGARPQPRGAPEGNQRTVYVLRDGAPVAIDVRVGASDGRRTEIRSGELADGDAVIVDSHAAGR